MTIFNFDWGAFWQTAHHLSLYEILMLLCFGASWPFSIYKTLKTGRSEGKSYIFLFLVMVGYLFGVCHKLLFHLDVVILLYIALFFVVGIDYLISRRAQKKARERAEAIQEKEKVQ